LKHVATTKDLKPEMTEWLASLRGREQQQTQNFNPAAYLATACMTNSQCVWGDPIPPSFGNQTTPSVVLTTLLILDANFQTLYQATVVLKRDAPWGRIFPSEPQQNSQSGESLPTHTPALDDARLFVHDGHIWVGYREGRGFGYETQVLNPLHIRFDSQLSLLEAWIVASETTSFCCGRNMALMESNTSSTLLSLTWVDPVTVVAVDTTPHVVARKKKHQARLPREFLAGADSASGTHARQARRSRRLGSGTKKSHAHGTNGFMVHLPERGVFLGVAHFHRPHDRKPNPYARFGHHYTHALYTVSDAPPYRLVSLSAEFVLPRASAESDENGVASDDAEIIQFASGLEVVGGEHEDGDGDGMLLISYGINDCEAAIVRVSVGYVLRDLLRPVEAGTQVVDVMQPLKGK
jgi:hypothetical protein